MRTDRRIAVRLALISLVLLVSIASRASAATTYSIGGKVTGLNTGGSVTLLDNGTGTLVVKANGAFTFATKLANAAAYKVTISVQPKGEICTVAAGAGSVKAANVTTVAVTCKKTYTVGGMVTGLKAGTSVTLLDNAKDALVITKIGVFTFKTPLVTGTKFAVTLSKQPVGQKCTLTSATGTIAAANITSVRVACAPIPTYSIGGTLSGALKTGESVELLDNGGNALTLSKIGAFAFTTKLVSGTKYAVTIGKQPAGELCKITAGAVGTVAKANITSVNVSCAMLYTIGGSVSGLTTGKSVTLLDNLTDSVTVAANGTFKFPTALATGAHYSVTVKTQPAGEKCVLLAAAGTVAATNVTSVDVVCSSTATYTIGGTVTGLASGAQLGLSDNASDPLIVTGTSASSVAFKFAKALLTGATYSVAITAQPAGETCTITPATGSGTVAAVNVTTVAIVCTANPTYTIGGTVAGLTSGAQLGLSDNTTDSLTVTGTSASSVGFTFSKALASGANYSVAITAQPAGETCSITTGTGSGKVGAINITTVAITCTAGTTYTVGGNVTGLHTGQSVTLLDNGGDSLTLNGTGSSQGFNFKTGLATGANYLVSVGTQPAGEFCGVTSGSGKIASANISNVAVACTPNSYNIGGNVTGLATGQSVTLLDNGGDALTVTGTGSSQGFTFDTSIDSGSTYAVTVGTQPETENCIVTAGTGTVGSTNVTNVAVACSAIASFTIGGNLGGLTSGTVTLLDNGGDAKTLTANGAFTFASKVGTGRKFNVTVGTQPAGLTCTVTGGSGTVASANITNVAVACSKSGGSGGGTAYWIPYSAKPQANLPQGQSGTTGLFLIPSDKITSAPAPEFVTSADAKLLGISYSVQSGTPATLTPDTMMYAAVGKDGNTHVYGIALNDTSTFPTPVQISSLSLGASDMVCEASNAETDLSDSTTLFALIEVGDAATECGTTSTFEVVHFTDSTSTAPKVVSVNTTSFDTLYNAGSLVGLVMNDPISSNLYLYANNTFTSPTTLLSNIDFEDSTGTGKIDFNNPLGFKTNLFINITTNSPSTTGLYYLAAGSSSLSFLHAGDIGSDTFDENNFYFTDTTSQTQTLLYQVANTGGTPKLLYTGATTTSTSYDLIGGNDTLLAFYTAVSSGTPGAYTNKFFTIPIGSTSSTATQIGATAGYTGVVSPFLASPGGSGTSGNKIFISIQSFTITPPSTITFAHSSFVLPFTGSSNPTPTANSVYNPLGLDTLQLGNGVWQVTGISDTDGGWGGSKSVANVTNVSTLANTPFTTVGGGDYSLPSGYEGDLFALGTDEVGLGLIVSVDQSGSGPGNPEVGLAADLTSNFVYPISIVNTNVAPF